MENHRLDEAGGKGKEEMEDGVGRAELRSARRFVIKGGRRTPGLPPSGVEATLPTASAPRGTYRRCAMEPVLMRVWVITVLHAGLLAAAGRGQGPTLDQVRDLERRLATERQKNEQQAQRIEELELTVVSILATQDARDEAAQAARLEALVDEKVAAGIAGLAPRQADSRSPFRISGRGRFVTRVFSDDTISTDRSFELEHLILQVSADVGDGLSLHFTPAASHRGGLFIIEAHAAYQATDWLEITAGRFLVPFNGTHAWAFPSDSFIEPYLPENAPKPFMYAPWWDEGVMASGGLSFGAEEEHRFWYAAYVINGFDEAGLQGIHKRNIGDNNDNKTLGGRVSVTLSLGEDATLALGAAVLYGKYDAFDDLEFFAVEADLEFATGPFSLYLEVFHLPQEIQAPVAENPAFRHLDVARTTGVKVRPRVRVLDGLTLFAQADWLLVDQPRRTNGQFSVMALDDERFEIRRFVFGARIDLTSHLVLELEAGIFDRDAELGEDIRYLSASFLFWF